MALLAAVGIFGCKSDPSGVTPDNSPAKIVANPAVLTVAQGASKTVTIAVVDSNGNAIPAEITAAAGSADITVTPDTSEELVYGPDGVPHANTSTRSTRFTVTGAGLNATTITVTAGSLTTTLPVVVTPTELAATLSSTSPALGAPVVVTAPAGLTFASNATVTRSTSDTNQVGFVTSTNGGTLTFVPFVGTADQPFAVRGVIPSYAPTLLVNLDVPSSNLTVGDATTLTKISGTDALGTAPELAMPGPGLTQFFYDKGPFGFAGCATATASFGALGAPCTLYKIVVTDAGTVLHATVNWPSNEDLGLYVLDETGTQALDSDIGSADAHGGGAAGHPETGDLTFDTPGTYYIAIVNFSGTDPLYFSVQLTRD
jgi:hypothetical protein